MSAGSEMPAIRTHELTKVFGALTALDALTLEVARGEIFGFLGPNGAGKTTTTRLLLGLARPTSGRAELLGIDVTTNREAAVSKAAYVPGEFACWPNLRGGEMLDLLGALHGATDPARRAELCERFEFDPTKRGRDYSKGNRQKIPLIAALMVDVDILVLDEPTSGLDPLMEMTFRSYVKEAREQGQTVFLSSHILSEVEAVCDRVGILRHGRLIDIGTLDEFRAVTSREVRVAFSDTPNVDLERVPGVSGLIWEGRTATFHLKERPGPLMAALADAPVESLDIREPSLEEMFLSLYGAP